MTPQTKGLLYYLARYLETDTTARRRRLIDLCEKLTGSPLEIKTLWRHTELQRAPTMDFALVYLTFLYREKQLDCAKDRRKFLLFANPHLLRQRPKK